MIMNLTNRQQPIYVFQVTPEISLIWTTLGSLLLIIAAAGASWYYATIHGETLIFSVESSEGGVWRGIIPFIFLFVVTFGTIIVHELVHGIAFAAFGGSPRYGLKIKYLLPLAYATSPGNFFRRNNFLVIGLAPLVVIDILCLLLLAIFPQAPWLIWVIAINTGGAIGDIWMAVQLIRCPQSIRVEDREEGMAIYAPLHVTRRELPFGRTDKSRPRSVASSLLNFALMALCLLLISTFLLIPILKILAVPSFIIGNNYFWILRWENTTAGFSLGFNWISILLMVLTLVIIGLLVKMFQRHFTNT
ncbi:hypothetical protein FDUTEX481_00698 [Tolypothrix sp. PCC 7601]|nr:hypothetical protein FDUTEX481_00698 [Tolypothrix sp. PCC 7601]BAY92730.1 hypothetical protein NIES3275_47670 [Microchaete diplosiphon NIES-3275]